MNLNQLRYVAAVAEERSFSNAAKTCCITQPALSNSVSQLEEELGGRIFSRTTRSVSLTRFGERVLVLIEAVLGTVDELERTAYAFHNPEYGLARIGMSPLVDVQLLTRFLEPARSRDPKLEVFFKQCYLGDLEQRLADCTIDLAIVPRCAEGKGERAFFFYEEDLFYLPREIEPESQLEQSSVSLAQIASEPIILTGGCGLADVIRELFAAESLELISYPGQALDYRVVEEWAGLGVAAGILPRSKISQNNHSARPLTLPSGQAAKVFYDVLWNPEAARVSQVRGLLDSMQDAAPVTLG